MVTETRGMIVLNACVLNVNDTVRYCFCLFQVSRCQRQFETGSRRGRDRMTVGFTTTCAISAYSH
jgi:hypothetical protein